MHQNILDPAGKDITQVIQRSRRDVSVVLERVQCAAAEGVILDERIGRNALSPHGAPKRFVRDHKNHLTCDFYSAMSKTPKE